MKNKRFLKVLSTCLLSSLVLVPMTSCLSDRTTIEEPLSDKVELTLISKTKDGKINSTVTQLVKIGSTWRVSNKVKPSVDGYEFKGWFLDESFVYEVDDGYVIEENTTFYGKYVLTSDNEKADTPDSPDTPNNPDTPDNPNTPDSPNIPDSPEGPDSPIDGPIDSPDDKTDETSDYYDFASMTWDEAETLEYSQSELEDMIRSFGEAAFMSSVICKTNSGEIEYGYDKENKIAVGDFFLAGKATTSSRTVYVTENRCYYKEKTGEKTYYEAEKTDTASLFTKLLQRLMQYEGYPLKAVKGYDGFDVCIERTSSKNIKRYFAIKDNTLYYIIPDELNDENISVIKKDVSYEAQIDESQFKWNAVSQFNLGVSRSLDLYRIINEIVTVGNDGGSLSYDGNNEIIKLDDKNKIADWLDERLEGCSVDYITVDKVYYSNGDNKFFISYDTDMIDKFKKIFKDKNYISSLDLTYEEVEDREIEYVASYENIKYYCYKDKIVRVEPGLPDITYSSPIQNTIELEVDDYVEKTEEVFLQEKFEYDMANFMTISPDTNLYIYSENNPDWLVYGYDAKNQIIATHNRNLYTNDSDMNPYFTRYLRKVTIEGEDKTIVYFTNIMNEKEVAIRAYDGSVYDKAYDDMVNYYLKSFSGIKCTVESTDIEGAEYVARANNNSGYYVKYEDKIVWNYSRGGNKPTVFTHDETIDYLAEIDELCK